MVNKEETSETVPLPAEVPLQPPPPPDASRFGVFQKFYETTLSQSPSNISWIGGVQVFFLLFISTLSGRATYAGFARLMVLTGSIFMLVGTFMTSLATKYWQLFLAQGLCIGIGQGLMWLPSVTVISTYFVKKRVLAVTTAATGTSTGGMIFPAIIQHLTPRIGVVPWAVGCMGFVVLFMVIIINLLLRTRLPPRRSGPLIEWAAFIDVSYMLFTFGILLLYWTLYFAFFYIQVCATEELGLSQASGVNLIMIINAAGVIIRAPCGYLADQYIGPLNCLIPWVALCGILIYYWAAVHSIAELYVFNVFYGLASAAAMGLFAGTVPSLTKDINKIGTRVGMVLTLISVGPLTGPSVAGAWIAHTGGRYFARADLGRPIPSYNPIAAVNAPAGTFLPGTKVQIGNHRVVVEKYLSEGGFAHVYVVHLPQPIGGSDRAVLKRVAVPDKAALANMRTEVETMKKLKGHRHIVKYIDSHASQLRGGGYEVFLLMEFCSGGGLIDFMNTRLQHRLTEPEIIQIFSDVAEGVACMHYLKPPLLHRDLKVENVLISRHGSSSVYKLCDFGSAAPPRPAATSAAEGRLIEDDVQRHTTLQYRSPEMIDVYRKQPIDEKSDIWALGVLLYKLCYYTTPFEEVGQMAILNATFKFPNYPIFSERLRMLIAWMLKENPQKRPNIYEVVQEVCRMQGKEVPIQDIYATRSTSEARRYQELPPSPTEAPQVGAVFSPPVQETAQSIPEIAPMRRGRPTKPSTSQHTSAKPSPSPFRGGASTDPFAVLDGESHKPRNSTDEFANRFPSLDQFDILHEKGGKFDFEPTFTETNQEGDDLSRRLTNALADEAFAKHPSSAVNEQVSEPPVQRQPQAPQTKSRSTGALNNYREEAPQPQIPLYQPVPQKPGMVSTGTMTSPPHTPTLPEMKPSSRPVYRFPSSDHQRRPSSQPWPAESDKKASRPTGPPSPTKLSTKMETNPRVSADRISDLSSSSSRLSLDGIRPSLDELTGRSKSANSRSRPLSVQASSRLDLPRGSESARSSLDIPRPSYDMGAPLQHARTEADQGYDRANISSDIDYLRAREEESSRKKEKRYSSSSKHTKRSSLSTLSLSGTKTLFAGRFGEAFRRFEQTNPEPKAQSPAAEEPKQGLMMTSSELVEPPAEFSDNENDDISPEMRRELERRRLSQEEKRVANAAAEYRRQVSERGEGGYRPGPDTRSLAIQNRVQTFLEESGKSAPPPKTATGYGRFTEESNQPNPALQAKQKEPLPDPRINTRAAAASVYGSQPSQASPVKDRWETPSIPSQETASTGYAPSQRTGSSRPPVAPPKPRSLRVKGSEVQPMSERSQTTPTSPGEDWEANFSRRYPSLSGLEMVETEIEIPNLPSLRTKEV
ncbi:hypothetical protein BBP40_004289 [Aspergillus hancockii]|nr:hypothetical protein BBP40_004289 [Aspergillus hancockii]